MAQLIRPLRQWPPTFRRHHRHAISPLNHLHLLLSPHTSLLPPETGNNSQRFATTVPSALRNIHQRSRLPKAPGPYEFRESGGNSESDDDPSWKSRNQKKREARRAVQWGMDLASFSTPQIKRILRAASLEEEVFEALMLVKRMGRDVREGKRRQFNYIGKLLRDAEPELMDGLIQATKDGDQRTLQALSRSETAAADDEDDADEDVDGEEYEEEDDDQEESLEYVSTATRWFDGLVSRDTGITNEVYSIHGVDYDRQELRRLVRKVHSIQEQQSSVNEDEGGGGEAELTGAKKSLARFLRTLAKQMPTDEI